MARTKTARSRPWLIYLLLFAPVLCVAEAEPVMEEIVVKGRQPGPRLWKVTQGERALWILPLVSVVPKDMIWEDDKVAAIIATADEVITTPGVSVRASKLLMLNPINWVRGSRLLKRLSKNPGGATLAEVLPAETYQRYDALKQKYFPRQKDIEQMRPAFATGRISQAVLKQEQLTDSSLITRRVDKLIRRNRAISRIDVEVEEKLEGGYGDLSERLETMADLGYQVHAPK